MECLHHLANTPSPRKGRQRGTINNPKPTLCIVQCRKMHTYIVGEPFIGNLWTIYSTVTQSSTALQKKGEAAEPHQI